MPSWRHVNPIFIAVIRALWLDPNPAELTTERTDTEDDLLMIRCG
jgi:hypothetical protein